MNIIAERSKIDKRKFEFIKEPGEFLRDLNTYFPKLMNYLWEQPKIVSFIIQNTDINYVGRYLAPLFADNFYENILSSNFMEDNLMYVITLLLEGEINKINNINQCLEFLDNSPCGCLLEELRRKNDIQNFFKTIIYNSVEDLEVNHSSKKISFNIKKINEEISKIKNAEKNKNKKKKKKDEDYMKFTYNNQFSDSISLDSGNSNKNRKKLREEQETFNQKYIPPLDKNALQVLFEENKNNKNMYDFLYTKINDCNSNKELYSDSKLMLDLNNFEYSIDLLTIYQKYFIIVINFINTIIEKILDNFHLIPYSVKCICKIILLLVEKKFPSINETEKNAFIAKFFFGKLLIPILKNPGLEAFINNFIISQNTFDNLNIISIIINRLTSASFYKSTDEKESDFTPYNWYFIEKMEKIIKIFNYLTKISIPSFIEKYIKGELPQDYEFNYFKENPDEVITHRSIFFNLAQVKVIIMTLNKFKNKIFTSKKTSGLEKTVEKLTYKSNEDLLDSILKSEKHKNNYVYNYNKNNNNSNTDTNINRESLQSVGTFDSLNSVLSRNSINKEKPKKSEEKNEIIKETKPDPKQHYFMLTSLLYNERYTQLFNIKQDTESFSIDEIKNAQDEESITKNNIIKVKNFFCSLLYNYNKLVKTDFEEGKTENTEKILNELKTLMKSSNFDDGNIPSEWYVTSLLEYLKKIPEDLTKNDCEELYKDIENDVNKSIKELDFEALSVIMGKLKFAKMGKRYFDESKKLLIDIKLNEESKLIIERYFIPVDIKFCLEEEEIGEFAINRSLFRNKDKLTKEKIKEYERKNENIRLCVTINEFIKKFPNLVKYQEYQDLDVFEIQKNLNFSSNIDKYLGIIKDTIKEHYEKGLNSILEKINDYIMSKVYDKIFPIEPYEDDNKIFQQSIKLSWTEPKHFIKSKRKLVFGSFLTDFLKFFKTMDSEKSPNKKLSNMMEIFNSIGFLLQFNGAGKDIGVDDQLPILNYAFIKVQPLRMYSNAKFMELYIGERKNKIEGNQLAQLLSICKFIANITPSQLFDVTQEEYIKNCNDSINLGKN